MCGIGLGIIELFIDIVLFEFMFWFGNNFFFCCGWKVFKLDLKVWVGMVILDCLSCGKFGIVCCFM